MTALLSILTTLVAAWQVLRWNDRRELRRRARRIIEKYEPYTVTDGPYDWGSDR